VTSEAPEFEINELGQPVGKPLAGWSEPPRPQRRVLVGRMCRVEPLDPVRHAEPLYAANSRDVSGRNWTYLPYGPFPNLDAYRRWAEAAASASDPLFYAVVDGKLGNAIGVASFLRISPENGSIEVGHINFSPLLQRSASGTEAMFLMMAEAFGAGYRRYEWKCDALNRPSRAAARRLGFAFEGVFRHATVVKGRNRDTAWYAITDDRWPAIRASFLQWLDAANFDASGHQKQRLAEFMAAAPGHA
jgi:RimJ/RimL family protein N-acetyltransferase